MPRQSGIEEKAVAAVPMPDMMTKSLFVILNPSAALRVSYVKNLVLQHPSGTFLYDSVSYRKGGTPAWRTRFFTAFRMTGWGFGYCRSGCQTRAADSYRVHPGRSRRVQDDKGGAWTSYAALLQRQGVVKNAEKVIRCSYGRRTKTKEAIVPVMRE